MYITTAFKSPPVRIRTIESTGHMIGLPKVIANPVTMHYKFSNQGHNQEGSDDHHTKEATWLTYCKDDKPNHYQNRETKEYWKRVWTYDDVFGETLSFGRFTCRSVKVMKVSGSIRQLKLNILHIISDFTSSTAHTASGLFRISSQ